MDYKKYFEARFTGDDYDWNFASGLTLTGSSTTLSIDAVGKDAKGNVFALSERKAGNSGASIFSTSVTVAQDTTLEMISALALQDLHFDRVHRLMTFWSEECTLKTDTLDTLQLRPAWGANGVRMEKFYNASSAPNKKFHPFICLENSETGEFLALMMGGGNPWQFELFWRVDRYHLVCGPADSDVGHWRKNLKAGETFTTDNVYVATGTSLEDVCAKLVAAQSPDYSKNDDGMPVIFNEYCTTWGNPSEENVLKILDSLKGRPVKYFVIDAGWYKENEEWFCDQGNWNVNTTLFPHGMKTVTDSIRKEGLIPGIWFEMEIASKGVSAFHQTEHLVHRDGVPLSVGGSRFWDMTDPWVDTYLTEKIINFLRDNNFGYIKIDYNSQIPLGCDGYESVGEGLRAQMAGTRRFFQKIKRELPDLVIELCASGGHRMVPDFLQLASQASFSDAHECDYIPVVAANVLRVMPARQNQIWCVLHGTDSKERVIWQLANAMLGRMCLSGDVYNLADWQWQLVDEAMDFYREVAPVIEHGTITRIENTAICTSAPTGYQIVEKVFGDKKLTVMHRFAQSPELSLPAGKTIRQFGSLSGDWTAAAYLTVL